jgi:hypothetical protein
MNSALRKQLARLSVVNTPGGQLVAGMLTADARSRGAAQQQRRDLIETREQLTATPTWTSVTLGSNTRNLNADAANYSVDVAKTHEGVALLRGIAERVTATFTLPWTLGTLPVGWRPARTAYVRSWLWEPATSTARSVRVVILAVGTVSVDQATSAPSGAIGTYVLLDGITFPIF